MTVKQLIEKLSTLPMNAEVEQIAVCGYENIENEEIEVEYDKKQNKVILS